MLFVVNMLQCILLLIYFVFHEHVHISEESLSSIEDTVEHSTGSKMEGCISESETSDVQELFRDHIRHPL